MFSATVSSSNSTVSWWMAVMRAACAASGDAKATGAPPIRISPASGRWMPVRIFTSVDLPAPFSPTSAVTRPGRSARSTPSSALTPGKSLDTPRSSSSGDGIAAATPGGAVDGATCMTEDKAFAPVVMGDLSRKRERTAVNAQRQ